MQLIYFIVPGYLSESELHNLKTDIKQELVLEQQQDQQHVNQEVVTDAAHTEEVNLDAIHQPLLQETEQGQQHPKDHVELEKLRDSYELNKTMYQGTPLEFRPRIPKFRCTPQLFKLAAMVDELILNDIDGATSLDELAGLVHCAAMSVGENFLNNSRKLDPRTSDKSRRKAPQQKHLPTWIMKIEKKINDARRDIGQLVNFFQGPHTCSNKVRRCIRRIARRMNLRSDDKEYEKKLREKEECLKQRIAALGARIRRYNEAAKRRQQDSLFASDQKFFYRTMDGECQEQHSTLLPTEASLANFWSGIWSEPKRHDENAYWLRHEEDACRAIPQMSGVSISLEDVRASIKKTKNWTAPGIDSIHNFWWKYFKSTHEVLATRFNEALDEPSIIPKWFTLGITYMKAKSGDLSNPKNYRPITCLPTLYKIFTSICAFKISAHLTANELLATEQNGCKNGTRGCEELLVIDTVASRQVRLQNRNQSTGWVDYMKAFDSVPHSWLSCVLRLYKIEPRLIHMLESLMATWRTTLHAGQGADKITTDEIRILRGIFQGDSLSPLWFCLSLNPLSRMLRTSEYGYVVQKNPQVKITHLFYMDDLKIYASNLDMLHSMFELVKSFSDSICMEFGLDKCAVVHILRGKVQDPQRGLKLMSGEVIQDLGPDDKYKYLGLHQLLGICDSDVRKQTQKKVLTRVDKICRRSIGKYARPSRNTGCTIRGEILIGYILHAKMEVEAY
ncbi:hypothetical protein B566_EDAN014118 [Ephemera danica]|nr:hypothetical protein B566_EDAN014118 [Ephemera danica]